MAKADTITEHIEITPGICGGKPCIAGHRIRVQDIVVWHERLGMSADEIASQYDLTLGDVYAALAYFYDHRKEVESDMQEEDHVIKALRARIPSKIPGKSP